MNVFIKSTKTGKNQLGAYEMKDGELIGKVHNSVYQQCRKRGYAAPADVLMDVGILQKRK